MLPPVDNTETIRVMLVDDHGMVRRGLAAFLKIHQDLVLVGEADCGREAITVCEQVQPDVILMDLVMPEMDGIEAISRITSIHPDIRILVMTSFATDDKVFPAIKAGALGYLLKDSAPEELIDAIRQVYRGEPSLHPKIALKMLQEISQPASSDKVQLTEDPLTEREADVLTLVARGLSNQEIAKELVISEATVRTHVSRILSKLHLASRTQAALYALRQGLASLDE